MRKILYFILIAVLVSAMAAPAAANSANGKELGVIPKTNAVITIDGVKDDVYNQGLKVAVNNPNEDKPGAGGGTAYLLWDDSSLYVFCEVKVKEFIRPYMWDKMWAGAKTSNDGWTDTQMSFYWMLNSAEVHIDWWDKGEHAIQFNTSPYYDGWNEAVLKDGDDEVIGKISAWKDAVYDLIGTSEEYLVTSGKIIDDNNYTMEWQFKFDKFKSSNIIPSGLAAEGGKFGINLMFTESFECSFFSEEFYDPDDGRLIFNFDWNQGTYDTENYLPVSGVTIYDYAYFPWVTLGPLTAIAAAPEEPVVEPAAEEAPQGGGEAAEAEVAPVIAEAAAPIRAPAANTGDAGMIALTALTAAAAAGVIAFKKRAVR